MALKHLKALLPSSGRRGGIIDQRSRSPKFLGDWSGVAFPRVTSSSYAGFQNINYDSLARLFVCHDLVWTCIHIISTTLSQGRLAVITRDGESITYERKHQLQGVLDFPNESMTQFDFLEAYTTHQLLYGKITTLLLREDTLECMARTDDPLECLKRISAPDNSRIFQMMPVHPSTVYPKNGVQVYSPKAGLEIPIHPNNILNDPFYNPELGGVGISPTHLLSRWLNLDVSIVSQFFSFFENGAIPSLIVNLKPPQNGMAYETSPKESLELMKQGWKAKFGKGGKDEKSPAFLWGDINVEQIEEKVDEMVSKGLFYEIQSRVCATYGVPSDIYEVGMRYGSQRATAEQAQKTFFNRTINPYIIRMRSKLNNLIVPSYKEENLEVTWDLSEMGIASFLLEAKTGLIHKNWELGITTRNETRRALNMTDVDGEYGDDFYRLDVTGNNNLGGNPMSANDNRTKIPSEKL